MKVVAVDETRYEIVQVEGEDWDTYYRYSSGNWDIQMGESVEPLYSSVKCEELEKAYQDYLKEKHGHSKA